MDEKKSIVDLLRDMGVPVDPTPGLSFCHCGTCQQAYEAGRTGALQLLEHQCPTWLMQIGLTYVAIAGLAYLVGNERETNNEMRMTAEDVANSETLFRSELAKISLMNKEALYDSIRAMRD